MQVPVNCRLRSRQNGMAKGPVEVIRQLRIKVGFQPKEDLRKKRSGGH